MPHEDDPSQKRKQDLIQQCRQCIEQIKVEIDYYESITLPEQTHNEDQRREFDKLRHRNIAVCHERMIVQEALITLLGG